MHGLATTLLNSGLARISAGATSALFPSIAAMTAIGARIFLDEELSYAQMLGGALVALSASMLAFARWRLA
jgi:drug/metabolite transporter (DMT)-like permease